MTMKRNKRPDSDYEIEVVSKSFAVLEALADQNFRPKKVAEIIQMTNLKLDAVTRILKTLRLRGYAVQKDSSEWMLGAKIARFGQNYSDFCLNVISQK